MTCATLARNWSLALVPLLQSRTCAPSPSPTDRPEPLDGWVGRRAEVRDRWCWRVRVPLIGKSAPHNRGPGHGRWPVTLAGGRDMGPGRQNSLVSFSSDAKSLPAEAEGKAEKRQWGRKGSNVAKVPSCQGGVIKAQGHLMTNYG